MKEDISSIIILGETGVGKSSLANKLFEAPKCDVGNELNSETEKVEGYMGEGKYSDIFIIDTPGLNDSNGAEKDKKNINDMHQFIKENPRIKGIIILLKFIDNRLTGSIKNSIKTFADLFPANNFWDHVVIVFSHFGVLNQKEREDKKKNLKKMCKKEFSFLMKETQLKHTNFILPESEEMPMYFIELKNEDENSDKEIENIINHLRKKERIFKKIEEKIEEPKIVKTEKSGNVTTYEYVIERVTSYTDFDDAKNESRKVIDNWVEKDIEEKINEMKETKEDNKIIKKYYDYKKIIHYDRNNQSKETIYRENPLDSWTETQETIILPEEVIPTVENNNTKTTFHHKIFKQTIFTDRYGNQKASKDKELIEEWKTIEEIVDCEDQKEDKGNKIIYKHFKKKITTDRNGNKTEGEQYYAGENEVVKPAPVVVHQHHYHHNPGPSNFFSKTFRAFGF